jgi:tRNA splicing endonuclease
MFHASYIVVVVGWEDPLPPLDMVAVGRVAVGVKKATVFASVVRSSGDGDDGDGASRVNYVTIDWRGVT